MTPKEMTFIIEVPSPEYEYKDGVITFIDPFPVEDFKLQTSTPVRIFKQVDTSTHAYMRKKKPNDTGRTK